MSRIALLTATGGGAPPDTSGVYALYSSAMPDASSHEGRTVRVGATRDHTTIVSGIATADALRGGTGRALVIIDPGTYTEQVSTAIGVDMAGSTGNPADITIQHTCPTGFSPLNTWGGPLWVGGITVKTIAYPERTGTGTYSIHHHGSGLTIFERVTLDNPDKGSIGMDGDEGSDTWLIDCTIANNVGGSDLVTNMHGAPDNTAPLRLVYDNCDTNGLGVNYNSLDSGQDDELYVIGGSVPLVYVNGSATTAVIDPAVTTVNEGAGVTVTRGTTLPARPVHGIA